MKIVKGIGVSEGIAIGPIFHFKKRVLTIERRKIEDVDAEYAKFQKALTQATAELDELAISSVRTLGEENALLFRIHRMMLEDLDYQDSIKAKITKEFLSAEYAVHLTAKEFSDMFRYSDDKYMQARAVDVMDVSNRVIDILLGNDNSESTLNGPSILYSKDFTPSETAQFDRNKVLALLTSKGSVNSHTSIFARTMAIPAIVGLEGMLDNISDGTIIAVDGKFGNVYIEPDRKTLLTLKQKHKEYQAKMKLYRKYVGKPTQTSLGRKIKLYANVGSLEDVETALENDAEGIGLLRSEFLYLGRKNYPTEQELYDNYRKVVEKMGGRPVIIRTLDVGADKQIKYLDIPVEDNPALGMRAIRFCLTNPEIFKTQLRAILRASVHGKVSIMFPMINSVDEVRQVKKLLQQAKQELDFKGYEYDVNIPIGIMIETPASAVISDLLAKEVDFFSIGTNDLIQYTFAIDRQNESLSQFLDTEHLALKRLIEITVKNAKQAGIWVGICGELAAQKSITQDLLRMGIDEISVAPSMILPLRGHISSLL